jgi:protein ImuA
MAIMRLISCHNGQLLTVDTTDLDDRAAIAPQNTLLPGKLKLFSTTLPAIDALLPGQGLTRCAVHELLWNADESSKPFFFAACLARAATKKPKPLIWSDPGNEIYPPALAALGIPFDRLFLLKPKTPQDQLWAVTQCLACKSVGATVAMIPRLNRIQARRLQLAAERGGGVGLILRPYAPRLASSKEHAAATRWLIQPAPGERTVQRWKIQLIHGHGGLTYRPVYLEYHRDRNTDNHTDDPTDRVRATDRLAHRPPKTPPPKTKRA